MSVEVLNQYNHKFLMNKKREDKSKASPIQMKDLQCTITMFKMNFYQTTPTEEIMYRAAMLTLQQVWEIITQEIVDPNNHICMII